MEDALVLFGDTTSDGSVLSLNPCFNGRCTRTHSFLCLIPHHLECLNPCFNGRCTRTLCWKMADKGHTAVLILVLMEDALVLFNPIHTWCVRYAS